MKFTQLNEFPHKWLGWQGSNLRMTGSKPVALPLGYTPSKTIRCLGKVNCEVRSYVCQTTLK